MTEREDAPARGLRGQGPTAPADPAPLGRGALVLGLLGSGALGCLLSHTVHRSLSTVASPSRTVHAWLADRDGGALVGLDREGLILNRRDVSGLMELTSAGAGHLWGLLAPHPGRGERRLRRLDRRAPAHASIEFPGGAHSLGALPGNDVGLLAQLSGQGLWLQLDGEGRSLGSVPAGNARGWALQASNLVLVGRGWVRWHSPKRGPREWRLEPGHLILTHGIVRGELWLLVRKTGPLGEVEHELWSFPASMTRGRVLSLESPFPAARGTWWIAPAGPGALWLVGRRGSVVHLEIETGRQGLSQLEPPLVRVVPDGEGGLMALSPGALQRIGPDRQRRPGQGGFAFLGDIALVCQGSSASGGPGESAATQ